MTNRFHCDLRHDGPVRRNNNVDNPINHLSLCTGYGGIDLGLRQVLPTCRTVVAVEVEGFAIANLVSKMEAGLLDSCPIFTDLHKFDGRPFRGVVDILSGGIPCQPFSHAGRRMSTEDPRHLFPSVERIIRECRPPVVFLENVEGIISSKLGGEPDTSVLKYVLERLEEMGYRATAGIFSAEEVGLPHRRKRVFILGVDHAFRMDSRGNGREVQGETTEVEGQVPQPPTTEHTSGDGERGGGLVNEELEHDDGERFIWEQEGDSQEGQLEEPRWDDPDGCCSGELAHARHDDGAPCRCGDRPRELGEATGGEGDAGHQQTVPPQCGGELAHARSGGHGGSAPQTQRGRRTNKREGSEVGSEVARPSELGDTEHSGSPSAEERRGNTEDGDRSTQGSDSTEQLAGASRPSQQRDIREGELAHTTSERLEGCGRSESEEECEQRPTRPNRKSPSRPSEAQQPWEFPRTIGETEETITAMGGSTHGTTDGNMVRSCRIDSLRLLGNGVVPDCAAKAFATLMGRLMQ